MNYATTVAFQVVFASAYGSSARAAVFAVTFGLAIAVGGIATATVQSVVVPRAHLGGSMNINALRVAAGVAAAAAVTFAAVAVSAGAIASVINARTSLSAASVAPALRWASVFVFLQVVAGVLIALSVAAGRRFLPAIAPAAPSIAGVVLLVADESPPLRSLYTAMAIGAAAEILVVALTFRGVAIGAERMPRIGATAAATALQLVLLAFLAPLERIMASAQDVAGAADFNYASRSLIVAQQLLIGGWILSALGDWSAMAAASAVTALRASLRRALATAGMVLAAAAAVGLVFAMPVVELIYERGAFNHQDSRTVAQLLVLASPGFVADGVGAVFSQALIASRRNSLAIAIGCTTFVLRGAAALIGGSVWGAPGVAAAYSIAAWLLLVTQAGAVVRASVVRPHDLLALGRGLSVGGGAVAAAFALSVAGFGQPEQALAGALAFACLFLVFRPELPRVLLPRFARA